MAEKNEMRNYSSQYINYGPAAAAQYASSYPQPQPQKKQINKGFNQLQSYQYQSQQQDFLSSQQQQQQQQFEYPKYYYSYQQQDACFDNDSMLSSNMIAQNPQFSESQDDICDMYFNQKAFLSNQEKSQQNEDQSSMLLPSNNQDIYYDIEEGVHNYDEDYVNQQVIYVDPFPIQIQNGYENYNDNNNNAYKNYNFSQNVYVPNNYNQSMNNQYQQEIISQQPASFSSQQCLVQQNSQQSKNSEIPQAINYQSENSRQLSQQQPVQSNQYYSGIQNIPQQQVPQNYGEQKEEKNEVKPIAYNVIAPSYNDQSSVSKSDNSNKLPINNGIIDDVESLAEECEQNASNQYNYSQENSNSSEQSESQNYNNSSKNGSGSYSYAAEDQCYSGSQYNYSNQEDPINEKKPRVRSGQKESLKDASSAMNSKKAIKKYKPKKKYKQSRQKNVFKNFGNALMNCIQNNFVIRDFIEKRLGNDAHIIEAFHSAFLKDSLNNLKNKEDFLQGWRVQEASDDNQVILFKQVFKEVSLKFFNEYAAKYVNESDKLKNKDIHIKAIPIFIRGLQNVNELYKFKLS